MRLSRLVIHRGVSFKPGLDLMHAWLAASPAELEAATTAWEQLIVKYGLGESLTLEPGHDESTHAHACVFTFLSPSLLSKVFTPSASQDEQFHQRLQLLAHDSYVYSVSYGLYRRLADYRGWVSQPVLLGRFQSLYLGLGRYCRLITMNLDQTVSGIMTLAGTNKSFGRDLLKSLGIPVAPGYLASTRAELTERAAELGYPVAVKAVYGGNSDSVLLGIRTPAELLAAAEQFFGPGPLLVEQMLEGVEFRLHFIGGKLFRVFRCEPRMLTGDGVSTIDTLLQREHPELHRRVHHVELQQKALLQQLWTHGVQSMSDLTQRIPAMGTRLRVSAATHEKIVTAPLEVLHPDDRGALEQLLDRFGEASAGIDVILREEGARLDEGGAVLEINSPCGFTYLRGEQPAAADHELVGFVEKVPGFLEHGGRVPIWLMVTDEEAQSASARAELETVFLQQWPQGRVSGLTGAGWTPILTDPRAEAFLIWITEDSVREHGMPNHLEPLLFFTGDEEIFSSHHPIVCVTTLNAKGTLQPLSSLTRHP